MEQEIYTCQVCSSNDSGCTPTECLVTLNQNL